MPRNYPNAIRPATKVDFEGLIDGIFSPTRWEHSRGYQAYAEIGSHLVAATYQPDDDGYAGWVEGCRYISVDHDPSTGVTFTEVFYFLSKHTTIVRFRAVPLHALIEKVIVRDGTPGLPEEITSSLYTSYWHHLHDASVDAYRSPAASQPKHIQKYITVTGSRYIRQFLESVVSLS